MEYKEFIDGINGLKMIKQIDFYIQLYKIISFKNF